MNRRLPVLILIGILLLLSSCVTKSPIGDQQYFQALGLDGEFVITVNASLLDVDQYIQSDDPAMNYLTDRMTRLSIALYDSGASSSAVVSDFSQYDYYGAIEGNFSKALVNNALKLSSMFTAKSESGLKFFVDEETGLEAAIPAKGIILFSSTDVVENRDRTYTENREVHISDEDATRLAASQIGLYISNPKSMIYLGFDITPEALANIETILLVMDDDEVSIEFRLRTEELANSFSIIIKAGYVGNLRREGIKVDVAALKQVFGQELNKVTVNGMKLSETQKESIEQVIASLLTIF